MSPPTEPEAEESPLRLLEDILHNRIMQKKQEMYKTELIKDLISRYPSYC
jgi:hypothetical protein